MEQLQRCRYRKSRWVFDAVCGCQGFSEAFEHVSREGSTILLECNPQVRELADELELLTTNLQSVVTCESASLPEFHRLGFLQVDLQSQFLHAVVQGVERLLEVEAACAEDHQVIGKKSQVDVPVSCLDSFRQVCN